MYEKHDIQEAYNVMEDTLISMLQRDIEKFLGNTVNNTLCINDILIHRENLYKALAQWQERLEVLDAIYDYGME